MAIETPLDIDIAITVSRVHQAMLEVTMPRITLLSVLTAAALAAGCAGTVGYSASVSSQGPDLVYAAPGVQVIADYDEPIFYSDTFYWRFAGGTWYRSRSYTGGWVYATPPPAVLRIERPHAYVRYHPQGWVARRDRVRPAPVVRDHRDERRAAPQQAPRPQPARGQDKRDDKNDKKHDKTNDKKHDDHKDDDRK